MKFVLILVEGETEATFVKTVLNPHLQMQNIFITSRQVETKPGYRGGIATYHPIRTDVQLLLRDSSVIKVTTMFDFYRLPLDFPGRKDEPKNKTCFERVAHLETAFARDINDARFLPYLSLHEFEAMLFSSPEIIAGEFSDSPKLSDLLKIRSEFASPEEINDNPQTAPSKRLLRLFPGYRKTLHGPRIARRITLARIRQECKHLDSWIKSLEALANLPKSDEEI
jgi:hypothetical protein